MSIIITLANEVTQLVIALYYFENFLDKKPVKKAFVITVSLFYMLFKISSYGYSSAIITLICFLTSALVAGLLYQSSFIKVMWVSITFVLIGLTSELIASIMLSFFTSQQISTVLVDYCYRIIIMIISKAILFLIIKVIIIKFSKHFLFKNFRYSINIIIFPLLSIINVYSIMYMQFQIPFNSLFATTALIVGLILLLMSIFDMQTVSYSIQRIKTEYELQLEKEKHIAHLETINNHESSIRDLRIIIHDFKNHLISLNSLNRDSNLEFREYYNEIISSLDQKIKNTYEGINNSVLCNILYTTHRRCKENEIELTTNIEAVDLSFLSPMVTNSIFSNLIDNAIRACTEIEKDRCIKIDIYYSNNFIVIEIMNSFSGVIKNDNEKILTTKNNELSHGYGLDIIKNAVYENNGNILMDFSEKEFSVIISFTIPQM